MRQLTTSQKKLLTKILKDNEPTAFEKSGLGKTNPIRKVENLPDGVWEKLEEINDTEILYQEVNHFIDDWRWAQIKD